MRSSHLAFALSALALGVCSTLACSALIGLDAFDKVDCSAVACGVDAADTGVDAADALPPPDAQYGDVLSNPTVWASWPMPNPVFDAGLGPDADLSSLHFAEYDGSVAGTVEDGWTGLIWSLAAAGMLTQQHASDYCASLGGQKWRLPSRIELVTLIDFTPGLPPFLDPLFTVDGGPTAAAYWTSSPDRTNLNYYWVVDFGTGGVSTGEVATSKAAICVTGGSARK